MSNQDYLILSIFGKLNKTQTQTHVKMSLKPELVQYTISRVEKSNDPLSKFGKGFHSFLFSTILPRIFVICVRILPFMVLSF